MVGYFFNRLKYRDLDCFRMPCPRSRPNLVESPVNTSRLIDTDRVDNLISRSMESFDNCPMDRKDTIGQCRLFTRRIKETK
jgi:hypothetical protein